MQQNNDIKQNIFQKGLNFLNSTEEITRSEYLNVPAIYCVLNLETGKRYIGSTVNLYSRFSGHSTALIKNKHENMYLQHSFNTHGIENFVFIILEKYPNLKNSKYNDLKSFLQYCEQLHFNGKLGAIDYMLKKTKIFNIISYNMRPLAWDGSGSAQSSLGRIKRKASTNFKKINSKRFYKFNLSKTLVETYDCVTNLCSQTNFTYSKLSKACRDNRFYKGYFWSYNANTVNFLNTSKTFLSVFNKSTLDVTYYDSINKCKKDLGLSSHYLKKAIDLDVLETYKINSVAK